MGRISHKKAWRFLLTLTLILGDQWQNRQTFLENANFKKISRICVELRVKVIVKVNAIFERFQTPEASRFI